MFEVSEHEIETLAKNHGAFIERRVLSSDQGGRTEISWVQLALRLPDDGTGALPLLRHIILNDDKSSTNKLALLRVLCRIADGTAGYARMVEGAPNWVELPLGLVALFWLRQYMPLLKAGLPQQHLGGHCAMVVWRGLSICCLTGTRRICQALGTCACRNIFTPPYNVLTRGSNQPCWLSGRG